jgi:hypothetical protein
MQTHHLSPLPEFAEWSGSPEWHTHLTEHGSQIDPNGPGFIVVAEEDCPGCECWTEGLGVVVEDLWSYSDGYGGEGYIPEQGYDWSGIRDSSPAAVARMFKVATANGFDGATR